MGEVSVSSAVQLTVTQFVLPNFLEFVARTTLAVAGIDPTALLIPVAASIAEAFGIGEILNAIAEKFASGLDELIRRSGTDPELLLEALLQIVKFIELVSLCLEAVEVIMSLVSLFLRKSIVNALEALQNIYSFALTILDMTLTVGVSFNPGPLNHVFRTTGHHIATNKGEHEYTKLFELIFDEVGIKPNDPANILPLANHYGPHDKEYHEWVFNRTSKGLDQIDKAGYTGAKKKKYFRRVLKEIGNDIMNNKDGMLDMITYRKWLL